MTAADLEAAFASLPAAWAAVLPGWTAERLARVAECVAAVSGSKAIAPADPFRAFRLVAPDEVKVVIVGQDPYPGVGHADGLAFSAAKGRPRSLARVFEVLAADRPGFAPPPDCRLDGWAHRGVLLLNPVLTVEVGRSASHMNCGWQALTREIVRYLSDRMDPPVFLLWGGRAKKFWTESVSPESNANAHVTRHPSYDFSRAFMAEGSHFEATSHLVDWWAAGSEGHRVL
ncbi:MAG: uracil-DNA glycosylase [Caldimonas sp.]